ncbi:uncharacterized protein LOC142332870 [Lycorma delicatula]|uniref:uncharacterized protein LOC142332870 n=1 Tax=Lycorma delicatula TaxID=130591 RepID=UPI003F511C7C
MAQLLLKEIFKLEKPEPLIIKGDVVVSNAVIRGSLSTIKKSNEMWVEILTDIVSKTDDELVFINGTKKFEKGLETNSTLFTTGLINGHNMSDFITTDTDQVFEGLKIFNKLVEFNNIMLDGTWDDINITELFLNNHFHHYQLQSRSLMDAEPANNPIINGLNSTQTSKSNVSKHNYNDGNVGHKNFKEKTIYFDHINDFELKIFGNITVDGLFGGINLTSFRSLLNFNDSNIEDNIILEKTSFENLKLNTTNGFNIKELNNLNCDQLIMSSEIEDVEIDGNAKFKNDVSIDNLYVKGLVNDVDFTSFVTNIYLHSDEKVEFSEAQSFDKNDP